MAWCYGCQKEMTLRNVKKTAAEGIYHGTCTKCGYDVHFKPGKEIAVQTTTPRFSYRGLIIISCILVALLLLASLGYWWYFRKGTVEGQVFIVTKGKENVKLGLVTVNVYSLKNIESHIAKVKAKADSEKAKLQPKVDEAKRKMDSAQKAMDLANDSPYPEYGHIESPLDGSYEDFSAKLTEQSNDYQLRLHSRDAYIEKATNDYKECAERFISLTGNLIESQSGKPYFENLPKPLMSSKTDADGKFIIQLPIHGKYALCAKSDRSVMDNEERYYWMVKVSLNGQKNKSIFLSNDNLSSSKSPESLISTVDN